MRKILFSLLTMLVLVAFASCAFAEAAPVEDMQRSLPPVNLPPVPEDMHAYWPLYTEEPALPVNITLTQSGENYIVTLYDAAEWGVDLERGSVWLYDAQEEEWSLNEVAKAAKPGTVELHVPVQVYRRSGLPVWRSLSSDETYTLWLEDYTGDPADPEFSLSLGNENGTVTMLPTSSEYTTYSFGDTAVAYCVYNGQSQLILGTYRVQHENGDTGIYAVAPNETEDDGTYVLYYISVQTTAGENVLWTNGSWQDIHGEAATAPDGFSAEELPFEIILP